MNTKLLRGATLSLGAVGAAVLAVTFLPGGVAAAEPEEDLFWFPDSSTLTLNPPTSTFFGLGVTDTGAGDLSGSASDSSSTPLLPDELAANVTISENPFFANDTFDITGGDSAIPTGSTIDVDSFLGNVTETVVVPGAGLFGLPEITETFFTPFGDFSF